MTRQPVITIIVLLAALVFSTLTARAQGVTEVKRPRITGLSHVALYMHDVEKSRSFYKDFLGFDEPYLLNNKSGGLRLTWIKINDRQTIELFVEKEAGVDRLYQVAIETDDAEAMRLYLASKGLEVPAKTPLGQSGNSNFSVKDPDGHILEVVQYRPEGWTMKDFGKHLPDTRISTRMSHAGIMVADLEVALKLYRDILGFQETWRGSSNGRQLSWVNMKVPDGNDYIEFMLYDQLPATERIRTLHHICLEVADMPKAGQTLKTRTLPAGCKAMTEMKIGINGKRQINLFDPDGTRVELMEPGTVDGKPVPSSEAPPPRRNP